jgi:hypothetical protein
VLPERAGHNTAVREPGPMAWLSCIEGVAAAAAVRRARREGPRGRVAGAIPRPALPRNGAAA